MALLTPYSYKDEAAEKAHVASDACQTLIAEIQKGNLIENVQVVYTKSELGFQSKL